MTKYRVEIRGERTGGWTPVSGWRGAMSAINRAAVIYRERFGGQEVRCVGQDGSSIWHRGLHTLVEVP